MTNSFAKSGLLIAALSAMTLTACEKAEEQSSEQAVAVPAATASVVHNQLTAEESADGWTLLFDGESIEGWSGFNTDTVPGSWQVEDGTLVLIATEGERGDLVTNAAYSNYEFRIDWKISKNGNSGIIYNIAEDEKYKRIWHTGPEMQVLDNDGHKDGKIISHRAGDLYDLVVSSSEPVKAVGEWNEVRLVSDNGHLEHWLNGVKIVETTMWDDNWRAMIAKSKFKDMKDFGTYKQGHIALQDHDDKVWFRNIKIKVLD